MGVLAGWAYRKPILYGTVFPGSNLTDFPKLFSVSGDTDIAAALAGGGGITVTLADGTTEVPLGLYPETALASGDILMRSLFDLLTAASTGDTLGYLYYDAGQTTTEDKPGVVANSYVLFMTMDQDPSGSNPNQLDWVTDTYLGTCNGTWSSGQLVPAGVGDGLNFNGSDDSTTVTGSGLAVTGQLTIECITTINQTIDSSTDLAILHRWNGGSGYTLQLFQGKLTGVLNVAVAQSTLLLTQGVQYWFAWAYNGSTFQLYRDGAVDSSAIGSSNPADSGNTFTVAKRSDTANYTAMIGDEVRVSSIGRSSDWMAYTYSDESNNANTFSLGAQEVLTGPLVASTIAAGDGTDATTDAIDTTTATGIRIAVAFGATEGTVIIVTDFYDNDWTALTPYSNGTCQVQEFFCANPTVGSGHTFTASGSGAGGINPTIGVMAFSGVDVAFDAENGATGNGVDHLSTGTVSPAGDGENFFAALAFDTANSDTVAIDSSFTGLLQVDYTGTNYGLAIAYKLQTTGGAEDPEFTWTDPGPVTKAAAALSCFKAAAATGTNFFFMFG